MNYDVGLLLDGLILVFLCVTIFYAARLTLFMKSFRRSRDQIGYLIKDLNNVIAKAEGAITNMQENAGTTEVVMREAIVEAKFLSDELRFMTETGDGLADRLEKLADRNRELVDVIENAGGIGAPNPSKLDQFRATPEMIAELEEEIYEEDGFNIIDFDLEEGADEDDEFDFMALSDGAYREEEAFDYDLTQADEEYERGYSQPQVDADAKSKVRSFAIFDRDYMDDYEEESFPQDDMPSFLKEEQEFHSRAEQDLYEALQRKKRDFDKIGEA